MKRELKLFKGRIRIGIRRETWTFSLRIIIQAKPKEG